ncbi:MFS general substrate transporter [Pluteus cervinus]|uniref:MFS general substrate transporter n=1 Tax=Pluteus cervinus TaxID=181527 RepID=A0ACD3AU20_9AGAR|nr:MFS general substrate transporter [Pluteus cervinus]
MAEDDVPGTNHVPKTYTTDFGFIPIPKRLRYDPERPFRFGLLLNASFGFGSTFVVANLYYCQPLLIQFALSFDVSFARVSRIPTLIQAGYATGLLLISPLGDLVRRRQLILAIVTLGTALTIGLAVTTHLMVFEGLCFLIGAVSVTPQILLPLAADLAPPERRASAISVVLSGLLFGVLIARVLAGVIAEFTTWRVVYYMAIGLQTLCLIGGYFILPDYPAKNKNLTYWNILWTMGKFAVTEPLLIQGCLINIASSACFSAFWVTLTFLLGSPPYNYSTLAIGLFGLIGMLGVAMGPLVGRLIDRLVPWYASFFSIIMLVIFQSVQTGAGGINIAAVILATFGLDVFRQMLQVSLSTKILSISTEARARLNAIFILSLFIGQVMGTAVGTHVFVRFGWRAAAGLNMAWYAWQLVILLLRGPHVSRYTWFGYEGGLEPRKDVVMARQKAAQDAANRAENGETESQAKERVSAEGSGEKTVPSTIAASAEGDGTSPNTARGSQDLEEEKKQTIS